MASENTTNESPVTVSFAGDVLAARIVPLAIAAMVALIGALTATGAFSDVRDAIQNTPSNSDAGFYEAVYEIDPTLWDDCFKGPLEAFMPGAIDTSKASLPTPEETGARNDPAADTASDPAESTADETAAPTDKVAA